MIKLFRKIRSRLLTEKIGKSFLNISSRIIFIVISILIALQINIWKAIRNNNDLEKKYYCQFLEDINQDEIQIQEFLHEAKNRVIGCNKVLGILQQETIEKTQLSNAVVSTVAGASRRFIPNKAAFEDVKFSGNLKIIKDIQLKNKLSNYYSKIEGLAESPSLNSEILIRNYLHIDNGIKEIWPYSKIFKSGLDTTLVNPRPFYSNSTFPKRLIDDFSLKAIMFLSINERNIYHYKTMAKEIDEMKKVLLKKCVKNEL